MGIFKKHKKFWTLLCLIVIWLAVVLVFSPQEIVEAIGVETGYFLIFLTALLGISGFVSFPFYIALVTLTSSGEFNIFLVILVAAPARSVGDILLFSLGHQGHLVVSDLVSSRLRSFSSWLCGKPYWVVLLFSYLYTSAAPLPKDFLMLFLGLGRIKLRDVIIIVLLGNATFIGLVHLFSVGLFDSLF